MTELKPCPFCGGEAEVYEMKYGTYCQYSVFGVSCKDDSKAELIGLSKYQHGHFIDNFQTEAEAIIAWNTRAMLDSGECENVSGVPLKFECSACGDRWGKPNGYEFNYCPTCGKKVKR